MFRLLIMEKDVMDHFSRLEVRIIIFNYENDSRQVHQQQIADA